MCDSKCKPSFIRYTCAYIDPVVLAHCTFLCLKMLAVAAYLTSNFLELEAETHSSSPAPSGSDKVRVV